MITSYQLQTYGIGCSLFFIRKDLVENKKQGSKIPIVEEKEYPYLESLDEAELTKLKSKKIIGCDLGKKGVLFIWQMKKDTNCIQHHKKELKVKQIEILTYQEYKKTIWYY